MRDDLRRFRQSLRKFSACDLFQLFLILWTYDFFGPADLGERNDGCTQGFPIVLCEVGETCLRDCETVLVSFTGHAQTAFVDKVLQPDS